MKAAPVRTRPYADIGVWDPNAPRVIKMSIKLLVNTKTGGGKVALKMTAVSLQLKKEGRRPSLVDQIGGALRKSMTDLTQNIGQIFTPRKDDDKATPVKPQSDTSPAEAALSDEQLLRGIAAKLQLAWEHGDIDMFGELCAKNVTFAVPSAEINATGVQPVWASVRAKLSSKGLLSFSSIMVAAADCKATVVLLETEYDHEDNGLPIGHAWLGMRLAQEKPGAPWLLEQLEKDPLWSMASPMPGVGKPAPLTTVFEDINDLKSLTAGFVRAWSSGASQPFNAIARDDIAISVPALEINTAGAPNSYAARHLLAKAGGLVALTTMQDTQDADGSSGQVLANVHVFDVAYEGADNTGRPRAHLSMLFDYSKGPQGAWQLAKVTGEPLWLEATGASVPSLTLGASTDSNAVALALTFLKAWGLADEDTFAKLASPDVALEVPAKEVDTAGAGVWEYRQGLINVGILALASARLVPSADGSEPSFVAYLHEFGAGPGGFGLPTQHANIKLSFTRSVDGVLLVSRFFIDVEWQQKRRKSFSSMDMGKPQETQASL